MQCNFVWFGVEKIALGQQVEMRGDFILTDAGNLFGDQFLVDHLCSLQVSFFEGVAEKETIEKALRQTNGDRSRAALLLNDSFSYSDGSLVTVSGGVWAHHSGSSGEVMVSSGRVFLSEANTEDVNASLAGQPYASSGTTNVFYASFTVKFTSLPSSGGAYFAHFKDSSSGFRARIWALTSGAGTGKFRLGISSTSGSVISATSPVDLNPNQDYTVVTRLVNSNSVATLWINPASESDASISTSEGASAFTVVSYALRESTGEGALNLDNLRVGTSFADVVSGGWGHVHEQVRKRAEDSRS